MSSLFKFALRIVESRMAQTANSNEELKIACDITSERRHWSH